MSSADLVALMNRYRREQALHIPTPEAVIETLKESLGPDDLVVTLGAGDVWRVGTGVLS